MRGDKPANNFWQQWEECNELDRKEKTIKQWKSNGSSKYTLKYKILLIIIFIWNTKYF